MFARPSPLLAALVLLWACERGPSDRPDPGLRVPIEDVAPTLGDAAVAADAAPSSSAVAAFRERSLDLPPRDTPAQSIAFGSERLAQLGQDALLVRSTRDFSVVARVPVLKPRAVAELADGSLLTADGDALHYLERDATVAKRYPRVSLLPGSLLLADRKQSRQFWVLHTLNASLFHHVLEPGDSRLLAIGGVFELGKVARGAFVAMKDGSFLHASGRDLLRVFPEGKKTAHKLPARAGELWRLLTTRRIDQAWGVWSNGRIELIQVAPQFRAVRDWTLPPDVFDVASSDRHVALLCAQRRPSGPRRWRLIVMDANGQEQLGVDVPGETASGAGEDWIQRVTRDMTLALSNREPLVAVGGPTSLRVWNIETKNEVFPGGK